MVINLFIHIKTNYDIKFRGLISIALFMVRVELGSDSPTLKNNYTKFGASVCFVPISSKLTTKQLDYYNFLTSWITSYLMYVHV